MMSAGNLQRYRNYSALMQQHEQEVKLKRIFRVFLYFIIIALLLVMLFFVLRWEQKYQDQKNKKAETATAINSYNLNVKTIVPDLK